MRKYQLVCPSGMIFISDVMEILPAVLELKHPHRHTETMKEVYEHVSKMVIFQICGPFEF
jgi:hypothetical protein